MKSDSQSDHKVLLLKVLTDFVTHYGDVKTDSGSYAKIAFYFASIDDAKKSQEIISIFLTQKNLNWGVLINTGESSKAEINRFNALNRPTSNDRIIILVGKGKEGWNCPSLFATALIRQLTSSNNFVLQASLRCLRQVPFNTVGATIYLDSKNCSILEKELNDVEGLTLDEIQSSKNSHTVKKLTILKVKIPAITIKKIVRKLELDKELPKLEYNKIFENIIQETSGVNIKYLFNTKKSTLQLSFESSTEFGNDYEFVSNYQASYELSNNYNIDYVRISKLFNQKFVNGLVPIS